MELKARNGKVTREKDKVVKEFYAPIERLNEEWFYHYSMYHKMHGHNVKVHEYSPNHIVMDYVEGRQLSDCVNDMASMRYHSKEFLENRSDVKRKFHSLVACYHTIIGSFYEYSSSQDTGFWHNDPSGSNLIYDGTSLMLVDPEEFHVHEFVDMVAINPSPDWLFYFNRLARRVYAYDCKENDRPYLGMV